MAETLVEERAVAEKKKGNNLTVHQEDGLIDIMHK